MTKQTVAPPPGDKPTPSAPPPPPAWRHWLWPVALFAALLLYLFLPAVHTAQQVTLSY
jgi:cell division protease FtsH